jgi:heme/copper-type cytochrome/quinol oxidase subunit 3
MSAQTTSFPNTVPARDLPSRGKVAMAGLIVAESAIFTIFVVAYLFASSEEFVGKWRA